MSSENSVLIIEGRFYEDIVDELVKGAVAVLEAEGVTYERVSVPGAMEVPLALGLALNAGTVGEGWRHHGIIALGCVIRGETSHYEIVANESAHALMRLAVENGLALGNGILTVENRDQAWVRAKVDGKDKGGDAAKACLSLMNIRERFERHQTT